MGRSDDRGGNGRHGRTRLRTTSTEGIFGCLGAATARAAPGGTGSARRGGGRHAHGALPAREADIATRQDGEHATALISAQVGAHTWRVVVGTGVALYLALIGTTFAGVSLLLKVLDLA